MRKGLTDITVILDRSGSMSSVKNDTIGGYNSFVEDQQKLDGECNLTLRQFDNQHDVVYSAVSIKDVKLLDGETFVPRGMTALLDAIGKSIVETRERFSKLDAADLPEKVICVILTDGGENSSREYNKSQINELITSQEENHSWEFVFLGANQDAISVGGSIGISMEKSMTFAANSDGVGASFGSLSANMAEYRSSDVGYSFKSADRSAQTDAGA